MLRLTPGALTNGQGALSWSFDSGAEVFNYLAAGESLTLTYSFTVSDTSGAASSPQSITITVYGSNDGPQLTGPQAVLPNTPEDASISLTSAQLLSGFSDPDASDSLRVTNLAATNGTLLQQPDGSWSYKPDPDVNGPVNLSYTVTDTRGAFISATNTFSITPLNDPPRRLDTNGPRSLFLIEDAPATTLGLANLAWATGAQRNLNTDQLQQITGDEALQTLSFSITALPDSAIGSLLLADNTPVTQGQTLSLAQLQSLRFSPTPNAYGNTAFSYTVTDSAGASTSESFSISVLPVNDLPVQLSDVLNPRVITRDRLKLEGGQYQLISLELAQLDISAGEATGQTVQYQIAALPDSTLGVVLRADGTTPVLLGDSLSTAEMRGLLFRPDRDVEKLPSANRLGQLQLTVVDDGSAEQGGAQSLRFSLPILVDVDKASGRMGRRITGITTDEQAIRAAMSLDPTNPSPGLAPSRDAQGNAVQTRGMSATLYSQLERDNPLYLAEIGGAGIIDGLPMNYVPAAVPFLFDLPVISNTPGEQITHTLTYKSTLTGQFRSNDSGANRYQAIGNVAGFELSAAGSWTFDPLNDAYQGINLGDSQLLTIPYRDRDGGPERILTLELSCIAQAPDGSRTIMATPSGAGANATTFSRGEWIQSSPQGREMDRYFKFISEATLISYGAIDSGTRNADGERVFTWLATAATADGKPLTLLDGTIITSPGYYDFTRRNGNGDGVEFIYQTVREKGRDVDYIVGMNFFLTNNMYGDNDPAANNIRDPGAPISVMPELGEIVYSSAFASYENISNDSLFAKNLPRIRFGNAAAGGPGTFDGGSGPLLNASDPGQGISAMTMSSSSPALPGANGAALSTGQAAINLQGGGDGDNTNNDSGDLASQGNAERAEAAAEGDGGSAKLAKSGQDKGQRGLKLDPIQQLGSAATAEPDTLLEQLSETNILGTNLLDALALGAGVLYLLYGPKARETGKGGLGTWLAGFGRRSGGSAAASGERAVLALFLTRVEGGKQQLVAARIGMGSLRLLAQRELGRDADADQLGDALQALLEQLPGQEAELLLLDPRLNGAATAAELNRLAQHQQPLASDLLAAPLAACSDSELAQLRAWLNKPSATSIEGLAIAELLRQRQQSYQSNLPAEQAGVASMVELSLALAWSQRQR
jgi:VCBS repeat-containing protein